METEASRKWWPDLQTLVLIGGIAATLVAWGYTLSELQSDTDRNTLAVNGLIAQLEQNDSKTDLNEARITALEKIATDALTIRRELEGTIGSFKSDIAVIKEILTRMDKDQQP